MTPLKSSSLLKTVRAVELKVMVLYSLDSLILFPIVLHNCLQFELHYCSVHAFQCVFFFVLFLLCFYSEELTVASLDACGRIGLDF